MRSHPRIDCQSAIHAGLLLISGILPATAQTAAPRLTSVVQSGGRRGTTVQITLSGINIGYGTQLAFADAGLSVEALKPDPVPAKDAKNPDGKLIATVRIAPDAALGLHQCRVLTPYGASETGHIVVGQWPEVAEKEPNNSRAEAQTLVGPVTVIGHSDAAADVDWYRVAMSAGEIFVMEAQAGSISSPLQPILTLQDAQGHELAFSDDLNKPDARLIFTAPKTGDYFLVVRDLRYQGGGDYLYRLTVGKIPYVTGVFPLGGTAGTTANLTLTGVNLPASTVSHVALPVEMPVEPLAVALPVADTLSNVVPLAVGDTPESLVPIPNGLPASAPRVSVPITLNGRLLPSSAGKAARNHFRFHATKGQVLDLEVIAGRVGSPLDSVLAILDLNGKELASNDDTFGKDSFLEFTAPATGDYIARLSDLNGRSGPEYAYRLRIAPALPDFQLAFAPDCPAVGPGDRVPFTVTATRLHGFDGDIALDIAGLPAGVHLLGTPQIGKGQKETTLLLTADTGASIQASALHVTGTASINNKAVSHKAQSLQVEYSRDNNNQVQRVTRPAPLPFASVTLPSDLTVAAGAEKVALSVGKTADLLIKINRKVGFTAKIPIVVLGLPQGVSVTNPEIPEKQSELKLTLKAEGNAALGDAKLIVLGRSIVDDLHFTEHAALPVLLTVSK